MNFSPFFIILNLKGYPFASNNLFTLHIFDFIESIIKFSSRIFHSFVLFLTRMDLILRFNVFHTFFFLIHWRYLVLLFMFKYWWIYCFGSYNLLFGSFKFIHLERYLGFFVWPNVKFIIYGNHIEKGIFQYMDILRCVDAYT